MQSLGSAVAPGCIAAPGARAGGRSMAGGRAWPQRAAPCLACSETSRNWVRSACGYSLTHSPLLGRYTSRTACGGRKRGGDGGWGWWWWWRRQRRRRRDGGSVVMALAGGGTAGPPGCPRETRLRWPYPAATCCPRKAAACGSRSVGARADKAHLELLEGGVGAEHHQLGRLPGLDELVAAGVGEGGH